MWGAACVERDEVGEAAGGRLGTSIVVRGLKVFLAYSNSSFMVLTLGLKLFLCKFVGKLRGKFVGRMLGRITMIILIHIFFTGHGVCMKFGLKSVTAIRSVFIILSYYNLSYNNFKT